MVGMVELVGKLWIWWAWWWWTMSTGHDEQYCEHGGHVRQCGLGEQVVDMVGKWWTVGWEARNGGWASSAAYWLASERVPCFARVQRPRQQFGDQERLAWSGLVLQPNPTSCPSFLTRCWSWPLPTSRPPARPPRDHFRDDNDNKQIKTMPKQQKTEVWPLQSSSPLKGGHLHYYITSQLKKKLRTKKLQPRTIKTKQLKIKD